MALDLAVRGVPNFPADYQGGAGIVEEIVGLSRRARLEFRSLVGDLPALPTALAPIQDPTTGLVYALPLSQFPLSAISVTLPDGTTQTLDKALAGRARVSRTVIMNTNYAATAADVFLAVTSLTSGITVTLPGASAFPTGQVLYVADESGACTSALPITIAAAGSNTIAGQPNVVMASAYQKLAFHSNGSNLWTFA